MADNFNLRSFLTENKLTKNAQLLKEQESQKQEVYYDDILFNIQARYPDLEAAIQGVEDYLDHRNVTVTFDQWKEAELEHLDFDGPCYLLIGPGEKPGQQPPLLVSVSDEDLITDPEIVAQYKADDQQQGEEGEMEEGADDKGKMARTHVAYSASVTLGEKDGRQYVQNIRASVKKGEDAEQRAAQLIQKHFEEKAEKGDPFTDGKFIKINAIGKVLNPERSSIKEPATTENKKPMMKEAKLTAKERRLVEMVNNAMGMREEDNVDYTMGRHDDPNQLPNPAPELNIPEGEDNGEMADENVIPEYHSIEELMKEIEFGTSKIAEEHKIKKMKAIAEALRAKVKNLEEGEHAKHIDQKAVKQFGRDIAALEKTAAKLQGVFDKKFNKKEKPASAPKAEKEPVALAEGNFDLRKFLIQNRK